MGKRKQGFNSYARSNKQVSVDNSTLREIKVDESVIQTDGYGGDTPVILPAKKRKTTKIKESAPPKAPLSKKERRKLESVVKRKQKKAKRADILEALNKVQVSEAELKLMTSTQDMHHRKTKKTNTRKAKITTDELSQATGKVNSIKGAFKRSADSQVQISYSDSSDCDITSDEEETGDATEMLEEGDNSDGEKADSKAEEVDQVNEENKQDPSVSTRPQEEAVPSSLSKAASSSLLSQLKGGVAVERDDNIQLARVKLPILGEEQQIIETISENEVTIVCGETGSGKTTQVPQFLYEAGYTSDGYLIGVTEPRRVAAISMSKRVAKELNMKESQVSYQIRYEGNTTPDTLIKFMTDGVLLKEIQNDFLLDKYRAIIIDEAHERSVYTDVLIGLLSRIVKLRHKKDNPLKLIIMSATLRVEDFRDNKMLFPSPPPVLKVDSRQYPVSIHFNKRTADDYLTEAFRKICKIHRQLPAGGILVFVTGKQEIHTLCRKLQRTFPSTKPPANQQVEESADQSDSDKHSKPNDASQKPNSCQAKDERTTPDKGGDDFTTGSTVKPAVDIDALEGQLPKIELDSYSALPMDEQAELQPQGSDSEADETDEEGSDDGKVFDYEQKRADLQLPLHVLPLHSLLNTKRQTLVFEPPPDGCRLCVISTNVAETSLTIPNVKYVIDCGKTKNKFYDKVTGVSTFKVTFTSQASANQRAGRAGRTGPGHCYRLYSSSVFNDEFEKFSAPEIVSRPVDDLLLQMNALGIEKVLNFPFPTPPSEDSLLSAQDLLIKLGAVRVNLQSKKRIKGHPGTHITSLGKVMALFPVAPRYARMLTMANQKGLLEYVLALVSACSVQELFMEGSLGDSTEGDNPTAPGTQIAKQKAQWAGKGESLLLGDAMISLKAIGFVEYAGGSPALCESLGIRYKAMLEARKIRVQLTNIVTSVLNKSNVGVNPKMKPPTEIQVKLIRQILLVGLSDHVARLNSVPNDAEPDTKKRMRNSYQSTLVDDYCYIHPGSVLYKKNCEFVIYQDIIEANNKIYLRGVTAIEPEWIPKYAMARCKLSDPLDSPEPRFASDSGSIVCHMSSTFGAHNWSMPTVELPYPNRIEKYRWFAKALLEGAVAKKMKAFVPNYLASPSIMVKSWARLHPRTETLLKALYTKKICTRALLLEAWADDPNYLLSEMLEWLPKSEHGTVMDSWPPIKHQPTE